MNKTQITIGKRMLEIYWISVVLAAIFLFENTLGYYHVMGGGFILFAHIIEIFVFEKTIKEHSSNLLRDRFLVIPYGFLVPTELKLNKK